jgi:hypothetical protein
MTTWRRESFPDSTQRFRLNFLPRNNVVRIRFVLCDSSVQLSFLCFRKRRHSIALDDAVPKRLYKLNLLVRTKLSYLIKELRVHALSITPACFPGLNVGHHARVFARRVDGLRSMGKIGGDVPT